MLNTALARPTLSTFSPDDLPQVDGLHHKAVDTNLETYLSPQTKPPSNILPPPVPDPPILELHGTLRHAHCLSCDAPVGRDAFQDRLSELNPEWAGYLEEVMRGERQEKLNPDGDVELGEGVRYEEFVVPECQRCGGPMKPVSLILIEEVRCRAHCFCASAGHLLRRIAVTFHKIPRYASYLAESAALDRGILARHLLRLPPRSRYEGSRRSRWPAERWRVSR